MLRDNSLIQAGSVGREALDEAARQLLARGNTLRQSDHGVLELRAGVGQRHAQSLACVALDSAQGRLLVALEREAADNPLGDARWQDYAGDTRLLAWSLAHETLLEALARLFGGGFVASAFVAGGATECLWLKLEWRDEDGQTLAGWLGLDAAQARLLATCADWKRDPTIWSMLGDASELGFELILLGRPLDPSTLSSLRPGDVLLLGEHADGQARLQADRATAESMFGLPSGWSVSRRQGQWMVVARPLAASAADAHRPHFQLTLLTMSPAEVNALQPGSVLSYDAALVGNTVEILFGERRFGSGVLVALGEWLGVRISAADTTF